MPAVLGNVQFCRAVYRLIHAPEKTQSALIEAIYVEHIATDADYPALSLPAEEREFVLESFQSGQLIAKPPPMSFWEGLMNGVEEDIHELFTEYVSALRNDSSLRRGSLKRRPDGSSGHHQLVATAETQLMERLAEMGKEGSDDQGSQIESETSEEEFLFKKVTSEMVATEINYVTDLKVTTTIFRRPLTEEKSAILPLEAFNIFANIEDVYALNRKFLTVLQKEHGKPLASKNYGKVFLDFAPQFQKVYLTYAGRKTISRNTLDQLSATNKKFVSFLEECLQKPPCRRLELKSFLIKPVQRICKYPLLLRTMVDNAPKGYQERASLVEAKKKMEEVVLALEDQLFVEDDKMQLLELEGALNWHREPKLSLAVDGRSLIYDSVLIVSEIPVGTSVDEAMMKSMRNVHMYLLNDIILLVERVEKKGVRRDFLYRVIPVRFSVVVPVNGKMAFQILQSQQEPKYVFRCASMEQKLTWVKALTDTIFNARNRTAAGTAALERTSGYTSGGGEGNRSVIEEGGALSPPTLTKGATGPSSPPNGLVASD